MACYASFFMKEQCFTKEKQDYLKEVASLRQLLTEEREKNESLQKTVADSIDKYPRLSPSSIALAMHKSYLVMPMRPCSY